jgi:hypothetical protein
MGATGRPRLPEGFPGAEALAKIIERAQQEWRLPEPWLGATARGTF